MQWLDYSTDNCSVQRTMDVIGEKWTMIVLREVFNGVRRFDQMRRHTGISDPVLSARLRTLVEAGILDTVPYREEGRRTRNEYRLTDKGRDLYPILVALLQWGGTNTVQIPTARHCSSNTATVALRSKRSCSAPTATVR